MADNGFDKPPDRYHDGKRETIDKQRDMAFVLAERVLSADTVGDNGEHRSEVVRELANAFFAYHCAMSALAYRDRADKTGGAEDIEKALWYEQYANHVFSPDNDPPDPRYCRPEFVPYRYDPQTQHTSGVTFFGEPTEQIDN